MCVRVHVCVRADATQRALQLSAIKAVGAVVRHAGPLLSSLHAIEIHSAVLAASTKPVRYVVRVRVRVRVRWCVCVWLNNLYVECV